MGVGMTAETGLTIIASQANRRADSTVLSTLIEVATGTLAARLYGSDVLTTGKA